MFGEYVLARTGNPSGVFWGLVGYIYVASMIYCIAKKLGTENPWMAFVPLLNLYLVVKMADWNGLLCILYLVPIVNVVFIIALWWRIAEYRGNSGWMGVLMVIPIVDFVVLFILAFKD